MEESLERFLSTVDKSHFSDQPFVRRTEKPWGWEILWTPEDLPYTGKILHVMAGKRLSLQVHDAKQETWYLLRGHAKAVRENDRGELEEVELKPGIGYTNRVGQRHRLVGVTDIDVLEVSTPEIGTTHRLEDDYQRPDETEQLRREPNRGWQK